ncbi:hypothetical protein [Peribacillus sp. AS_2]|uniref:hypothetical protein n=1 Tax=Peribacillus sp. AS_2 TaxID=2996755 RepID=UPI0022A7EAE5|nr:hypothetical protein [Peribacillus sp. AS_2]MCZ0872750.1 hypothetical protein [Peribacillus sp. AS_2]
MKDRLNELELKLENLQNMVQLVDEYSRHMTSQIWSMLGVLIAVLGGAAYFLIKNIVNDRVNKEIDKRLLSLIKSNPPLFNTSGSSIPDKDNKIYLNSNIPGIKHLIPERVLIFEVTTEEEEVLSVSRTYIPILRMRMGM